MYARLCVPSSLGRLQDARVMLEKREEILHTKVQESVISAKQALRNGNKQAGLLVLKKKKMYEEQVEQLYAQSTVVETQVAR